MAPTRIWDDAVARYLLTRKKVDSIEYTKAILRWLSERLAGMSLDDITNDVWLDLVKELREIGNQRAAGRGQFKPISDGRLIQYRAALSAVMNVANEAGWLTRGVPVFWQPNKAKKVVRWATRDEIVRLFAELPLHLAYPAAYAMLSGVRGSNVTGLRKTQVHWDVGLIIYGADETKDDDIHVVPITKEIAAVLQDCWDDHPEFVFVTHRGKPWQGKFSNTAWYSAMERAGVAHFTWHAWRHTWATWHRMNGTSLGDLQALGGWSGSDMVNRYAHFNNEMLIRAATNLSIGATGGTQGGTGWAQKVAHPFNAMTKGFPSEVEVTEK